VKYRVYGFSLAVVLFTTAIQAEKVCAWQIVDDVSVIADGTEWRTVYWDWVCTGSNDSTVPGAGGGGSGGGGTGGGTNGHTPFPPKVTIVTASDENPNQVALGFDYSTGGVPTSMTLEKNGVVVSSGPPSSFGLYGSLDNMVYDSILTVSMCNSDGCNEDAATVRRSTRRPRAEGAISAQWQDYILIDPYNVTIKVDYESYTRILEAELFYADYSVPTIGARNGHVKHVQTTDALLWENDKRPPVWTTSYQLVPSWAGSQITEPASETSGCYLPQSRFPNESPRCTTPNEFGLDGSPGVGSIQSIIASGSAYAVADAAFGALQLSIWP
jgi:hypothetical protein